MIKKALLAAAMLGASATPAFAVSFNNTTGGMAVPAGLAPSDAVFTFDATGSQNTAGFSVSGGALRTGNTSDSSAPAGDSTQYLSVLGGTSATFQSSTGYSAISFFIGSIDTYNTVQILSTTGSVIATYNGAQLANPDAATGNPSGGANNRRVSFIRQAGDAAFGGLRISSGSNSAEFDNLVFAGAVPEASTWAMMLVGFGMIGMVMRARRRKTNVVFA